jgi:hypothetical protein
MKTFNEYVESLNEDVALNEAVEVSHSTFENAHGKKPTGHGRWVFSHNKNPDMSKSEGTEFVTHTGHYSEAKKVAQKWAKDNGHSVIHVAS